MRFTASMDSIFISTDSIDGLYRSHIIGEFDGSGSFHNADGLKKFQGILAPMCFMDSAGILVLSGVTDLPSFIALMDLFHFSVFLDYTGFLYRTDSIALFYSCSLLVSCQRLA